MNNSFDPIITDLQKRASQILEAFNLGQLTIIEAERLTASLDREFTQKIENEYMYMARNSN